MGSASASMADGCSAKANDGRASPGLSTRSALRGNPERKPSATSTLIVPTALLKPSKPPAA